MNEGLATFCQMHMINAYSLPILAQMKYTKDLRNSISHLLTFFYNRKPLTAVARAPL